MIFTPCADFFSSQYVHDLVLWLFQHLFSKKAKEKVIYILLKKNMHIGGKSCIYGYFLGYNFKLGTSKKNIDEQCFIKYNEKSFFFREGGSVFFSPWKSKSLPWKFLTIFGFPSVNFFFLPWKFLKKCPWKKNVYVKISLKTHTWKQKRVCVKKKPQKNSENFHMTKYRRN